MAHADNCGYCKEVEVGRIAAAKRDLAVKVLAAIKDVNPTLTFGTANGSMMKKCVIAEVEQLFTTEGINLAPLTARKEKEGEEL
jgi:hypothetical protein